MPLNILAWNNEIGPWYYFVGLRTEVMINRDSWGMSPEEFKSRVLMFPRRVSPVPLKESSNISIPESWDWRDKGAVSPVRDQGSLGTCWAFSTAQNIEGQRFLKFGVLEQLSVEQLIECDASADVSRGWADCGMFGGWPYLGFQYLMKAGGIFSEKDYPYCAGEGKCLPCMPRNYDLKLCGDHSDLFCKANNTQGQKLEGLCNPKSGFAVSIRDWTRFSQDEREIADALVRTGPLSVLVNADSLQYYSGGIVDADSCDPTELDHAVLLVGYGSEDGQDYWIIKNSWGSSWGEQGYFRLARGSGACGVNQEVVTAFVQNPKAQM